MVERVLHERDLLDAAGQLLRWAELARSGARIGMDDRSAPVEREVIALGARGMVAPARLDVLADDAFTGRRGCSRGGGARRALRASGRGTTFGGARYALASVPRAKMPELAAVAWLELVRETEEEIDAAEDIARPSIEAIGRLLSIQRSRRARSWLAPVLEAIDRGEPMVDTAERIRTGAAIFEGRT
jgi:hypothetical protein